MSHTPNGPWIGRQPRILCLTAYQRNGQPHLLVQEHDATVAGSLRPTYVIETALWCEQPGAATSNKDLLLAIAAALMEMVNPSTVDGNKLSRG